MYLLLELTSSSLCEDLGRVISGYVNSSAWLLCFMSNALSSPNVSYIYMSTGCGSC